jgi:hypothetical protein
MPNKLPFTATTICCAIILATADLAAGAGADIVYSDCTSTINHGTVGAIRAYSLGTNTCNIGDQNLSWVSSGTPGCAFNLYRLHNGRLMQIGLSFVKTACCVANSSGCNMTCQSGGSGLRAGCMDTYSASFNSGQGRLAPRSVINPYAGTFSSFSALTGDAIFRRLQVLNSDLSSATFPGALYFIEGVYVSTEDAQANNRNNNASYKRVTLDASMNMAFAGTMQVGKPAIFAWLEHGNGANTPDLSVQIRYADVPNEGRFITASKVRDNANGTWRYEYAVFNLSSHRSGGSFNIPIPASVGVTNVGFHDVNYHSGEVYDNTDWVFSRSSDAMGWNSPQTFAANPNSNALRWGTMYNFWFDADRPPTSGQATIGLFRPGNAGDPNSVNVEASVPEPTLPCTGDIAPPGGDGHVNTDDLFQIIGSWGPCPGCPADIAPAGGNGWVNIDDLFEVIARWGPCQ